MSEERLLQLEARIQAYEQELLAIKAALSAEQPNNDQRIEAYRRLWRCKNLTVLGRASMSTPVLILGEGSITIGDGVQFGYERAPFNLSGYILIDARGDSHIEIGAGASINNDSVLIAEGEGIEIGPQVLIGTSVEIFDSDFHNLHPARRREPVSTTKKVVVERNAFIGSRCVLLKGSRIGADSVIGHSSVVSGHIPPGVVAAGSPARVLRPLPQQG
jgi:maltose O-acetyltransferase